VSFLAGVHGVVAIVLLCSLLFVEEAGVPLPFAPGELTLLAAGLLIAAGGLDPWAFIPLAFVACVGGAMVGYSWARIVGERPLTGLAARFHQRKALDRVANRIRSAGPVGIGVSVLIPGLRIYTTLVAGAFGVRRRTFVIGMVPSTAIWVVVFVLLGMLVGIPIEHFFNQLAQLAIQGGILLLLGIGGYLAIRHAPVREREPLVNVPSWLRTSVAALIDFGVVASIVTGLLTIASPFTGVNLITGVADIAVVMAAVAALYLFVTTHGAGATVGEALLHTVYLRRRARGGAGSVEPQRGLDPSLQPAVDLLRAMGTVPRLAVLRTVMDRARTKAEVAKEVAISAEETQYHLAALAQVGIVRVVPSPDQEESYQVAERFRGWLSELIGGDGLESSAPAAAARRLPGPAGAALP